MEAAHIVIWLRSERKTDSAPEHMLKRMVAKMKQTKSPWMTTSRSEIACGDGSKTLQMQKQFQKRTIPPWKKYSQKQEEGEDSATDAHYQRHFVLYCEFTRCYLLNRRKTDVFAFALELPCAAEDLQKRFYTAIIQFDTSIRRSRTGWEGWVDGWNFSFKPRFNWLVPKIIEYHFLYYSTT